MVRRPTAQAGKREPDQDLQLAPLAIHVIPVEQPLQVFRPEWPRLIGAVLEIGFEATRNQKNDFEKERPEQHAHRDRNPRKPREALRDGNNLPDFVFLLREHDDFANDRSPRLLKMETEWLWRRHPCMEEGWRSAGA